MVTTETRMAFERQSPSVELRSFLDPLNPGEYFDCGDARLHGIDEALEAEAQRRGRAVGDDDFQLVATDGGLIFCRASIMFAIAARWKDLTIGRPEDLDHDAMVLLPISWPTHGDLQFTVSRRLGSNVFRRWLQLQAKATRLSQVEQETRVDPRTLTAGATNDVGRNRMNGWDGGRQRKATNGAGHDAGGGMTNGAIDNSPVGDTGTLDLREPREPDPQGFDPTDEIDWPGPSESTLRFDESDRRAIQYATRQEQLHRRRPGVDDQGSDPSDEGDGLSEHPPFAREPDSLATLDAAVVDEWVDDRVPVAGLYGPLDDEAPTADPFVVDDVARDGPAAGTRFDVRPAPTVPWPAAGSKGDGPVPDDSAPDTAGPDEAILATGSDATETRFMARTADGTEVFTARRDGSDGSRGREPGIGLAGDHAPTASSNRRPVSGGAFAAPVPEISGARLQNSTSAESGPGPRLDIRSTLLAGRRESEWVEALRQRQVLILALVTVTALLLIAFIGFISGGNDTGAGSGSREADDRAASEPEVDSAQAPTAAVITATTSGLTSTTMSSLDSSVVDQQTTAPTLRVSSTSVQICHSNYGGCVPVAADVDCEGDGDGPAFQGSAVAVFGEDVYDLDTDDDRQACEADQPRLTALGQDG